MHSILGKGALSSRKAASFIALCTHHVVGYSHRASSLCPVLQSSDIGCRDFVPLLAFCIANSRTGDMWRS